MSNEVQQKKSFGSTVATYAAFPAITTAGSAAIALKAHGFKGIKESHFADGFEKLDVALKQQKVDVFSRSQALAQGYDKYKDIAKANARAQKKNNKWQKYTELPIGTKIKNFYNQKVYNPIANATSGLLSKISGKDIQFKQKEKLDLETIQSTLKAKANTTADSLSKARKAINGVESGFNSTTAKNLDEGLGLVAKETITNKEGVKQTVEQGKRVFGETLEYTTKTTAKAVGEVAESGLKTTLKGFGNSVKTNFKNELGWKNGKFNYIFTAMSFIPNVVNEVVPAFKEEGLIGGLKATGKTLLKAGADLVGCAAGASLGRIAGSAIGMLIPFVPKGLGARIGGNIGDMVGSMIAGSFVSKKVDELTGADEKSQELAQQNATQTTQAQVDPQTIAQAQGNSTQPHFDSNNVQNEVVAQQFANLPSREEVKRAAYAQAFQNENGRFTRYMA